MCNKPGRPGGQCVLVSVVTILPSVLIASTKVRPRNVEMGSDKMGAARRIGHGFQPTVGCHSLTNEVIRFSVPVL